MKAQKLPEYTIRAWKILKAKQTLWTVLVEGGNGPAYTGTDEAAAREIFDRHCATWPGAGALLLCNPNGKGALVIDERPFTGSLSRPQ